MWRAPLSFAILDVAPPCANPAFALAVAHLQKSILKIKVPNVRALMMICASAILRTAALWMLIMAKSIIFPLALVGQQVRSPIVIAAVFISLLYHPTHTLFLLGYLFCGNIANRINRLTHKKNRDLSLGGIQNVAVLIGLIMSILFALFSNSGLGVQYVDLLNAVPLALLIGSGLWSGNSAVKAAELAKKYEWMAYIATLVVTAFLRMRQGEWTWHSTLIWILCIISDESIRSVQKAKEDSLPLYQSTSEMTAALHIPGFQKLQVIIKQILMQSNSRKIFTFLLINFMFMFVEIVVGFASNSLGLLSDAAHMFFDCLALLIGLYASYISRLKPDKIFTYGYESRVYLICLNAFFDDQIWPI
jgi:hypothetical protein